MKGVRNETEYCNGGIRRRSDGTRRVARGGYQAWLQNSQGDLCTQNVDHRPLMNTVSCMDGLQWLEKAKNSSVDMVYFDPPFGHGAYPDAKQEWIDQCLDECWRVCRGIVYFHCDSKLLFKCRLPVAPRGVICWKNGWVSGFKSRSTKFWPKNHQWIVGMAQEDWRWVRVGREVPKDYKRRGGGGGGGHVVSDLWTDINPVDQMSFSKEKVGYKTQKPLALLERLISGSAKPGQILIDPTCGSGTSLVAAKKAGLRYFGCDSNPLAVETTRKRLSETQHYQEV